MKKCGNKNCSLGECEIPESCAAHIPEASDVVNWLRDQAIRAPEDVLRRGMHRAADMLEALQARLAKETTVCTNADRIRAMGDEELAAFWYNHSDAYCQNRPECGQSLDAGVEIPAEWCVACVLAWLRQPVKEVKS